jgi:hypothetical protein
MANSLTSNVTRQVLRVFLEKFEASRVLSKAVDTQVLDGKFKPSSGSTVDVKRPHDYKTISTAAGDISAATKSDIIAGKATATVQNFITCAAEWDTLAEAIELDQLDEILAPMAYRMVTDLELNLGSYMMKNCNLSYGTPGTAVDAWSDVAGAGSLMSAIGVPMDAKWNYVCNPYTQQALASVQNGLSPAKGTLVETSWERAVVSENFAGMRVYASNCLPSRTIATDADMGGTLSAAPTLTYLGAKDTMTQVWAVANFAATTTIKAGDILEVTGKYRASGATRQAIFDSAGAQVKFRGTVTADVTLSGGAGNVTIAGAAIYEANGAYNTTTAALASSDVITILGTSGATVQPALFFHPQAFGLATVKLPKLYSTDTVGTTQDGISIRVSRYADGDANSNNIRFDLVPAFATFNPFFAGQGFGV